MRKLIVSEFVSLDGVMEAPGGEPTHPHTGWVADLLGPDQLAFKLAELSDAKSLLLGRTTYESFAEAWPGRTGEMADKMNRMPKQVVTTSRSELRWEHSSVVDGGVAQGVAGLKAGAGGPILVAGSFTLVHTLLQHGLVDELRLMVFPVALGSGLRLFPESPDKLTFELAATQTFEAGVVLLTYRSP
jgi:dihydrofolate reductase